MCPVSFLRSFRVGAGIRFEFVNWTALAFGTVMRRIRNDIPYTSLADSISLEREAVGILSLSTSRRNCAFVYSNARSFVHY